MEKRKQTLEEKIAKAKQDIETQQNMRTESVGASCILEADEKCLLICRLLVQSGRMEKLQRMSELQTSVQQMRAKVKHLADNDPELLEEMGKAYWNLECITNTLLIYH